MTAPPDNHDLPPVKEIDRLIHEPARLLIMAHLYVVEGADFLYLMNQTGLTFGNMSSHMRRLEEAGYIEVEKAFVDKRPNTRLRLTDAGRRAFENYRENMRRLLA